MPFVDGVTLYDRRGMLNDESLAKVFDHLAMGLRVIHSYGIAHRDIKPENAMYELKTQRSKWIDFGLSCYDSTRTKQDYIPGTPKTLALET
jgi:serine/threonine protein kinase